MKRRNVKLIALLLLVATAISGCGSTKPASNAKSELPVYEKLENPQEDGMYFAIFADPAQQTVEAYQKIKDCGVRMVYLDPWNGTALDSDGLIKALEICEEVGLDAMIMTNNTHMTEDEEDLLSFVDEAKVDYTKYPAFKGVYAFDEPSLDQMDWLAEDMEKWENSIYKDYVYMVNMMRDTEGADTKTYLQIYWDKVLSKNDDNILLYDVYGLYADVGDKIMPYIREFTIPVLDQFANVAKEKDSDFYAYLQTYTHLSGGVRKQERVNDMRFQVAYNLAYGVQGFSCFTYMSLSNFDANGGMISANGEELPMYYFVQEVFKELQNFEHVYTAFDYKGTIPIIGEERGYGTQDTSHLEELEYALESHDRIEKLETEYDLLVGTFEDKDGYDGFLFTSYTDPYYMKDNEMKVEFKDTSKALIYYNGELLTNDDAESCYLLKDGVLEFDLEAGDYLFVIPVR